MKKILAVLFAALVLCVGNAMADSIIVGGAVFTLTETGNPSANVYDINYTVDTSGYNQGGNILEAIAFSIGPNILSGSLLSSPFGNWSGQTGGLANGSGCSGSGSVFYCAQASSFGAGLTVPGGTYSFDFEVTTSGPINLSTLGGHVKATFGIIETVCKHDQCTQDYKNQFGVSQDITVGGPPPPQVPEPASMVLLGTGLIGAAGAVRRKLNR